jgi:hypothetical protein
MIMANRHAPRSAIGAPIITSSAKNIIIFINVFAAIAYSQPWLAAQPSGRRPDAVRRRRARSYHRRQERPRSLKDVKLI